MRLERSETTVRVGDETDAKPGLGYLAQHAGHIVVELEVLARGPFGVDFARAWVELIACAAHALDDPAGVEHEDLRVVAGVLGAVEQRRRSGDRLGEARRVHLHAVAGAELAIAVAAEHRPRIDQREVDVEKHRGRGPVHWLIRQPGYGAID